MLLGWTMDWKRYLLGRLFGEKMRRIPRVRPPKVLPIQGRVITPTDPELERYRQFCGSGGSHQMFVSIYQPSRAVARRLERAYRRHKRSRT